MRETIPARVRPNPEAAPCERPAPEPSRAMVLALQRGAGNAAVARRLLQREPDTLHSEGAVLLDLAHGRVEQLRVVSALLKRWAFAEVQELSQTMPVLLRDEERAEMTLQFVHHAEGTFELARFADAVYIGNDDYLELLQFLQHAGRVVPALRSVDWRLEALAEHAKALGRDTVRLKHALALLDVSDGPETAARFLDALSAFGWDPALLQRALADATGAAAEARQDELAALDEKKAELS